MAVSKNSSDIKLWWKQALIDLETAESNWETKRYYACPFFSQQAVEKALKAIILQETKKMPPKIHRLYPAGITILNNSSPIYKIAQKESKKVV